MSEQVQAEREGGVWKGVRSWTRGWGGEGEAPLELVTDAAESDHGGWRKPGCRK